MSGNEKTIQTNIGEKTGESVQVKSAEEVDNKYTLGDGTILTVKTVITEIVRVNGEFDQVGNPVYAVSTRQLMSVECPDELMED